MPTGNLITYLRVSTARQGRSGLGIEAQREAVARYLQGGNWTVLAEHVEVESGRISARPALVWIGVEAAPPSKAKAARCYH